jgi:hypothetical protein
MQKNCRLSLCCKAYIYMSYEIYISIYFNRLLSRIFEPKREKVAGGRRKLQNDELQNLYSSLNAVLMIKSGTLGNA